MKKSRKNSKPRSKRIKRNAKRLAAYSAAAAATVMTTQSQTANGADQNFDILDIQTSGTNSVSIVIPTQQVGFSQYSSGWSNVSEGNFVITKDWFYAPLSDTIGAFANPATCSTSMGEPSCGTGIGPGPSASPGALQVYPLPHVSGPISAGLEFAARSYNSALSGFGNYANDSYFRTSSSANSILGIKFSISGSTHYGWIALSPAGSEFLVHGFGYNDVPGQPSTPDLTTVDLPGDINLDGLVNEDDWADLRDNFGADLSAEDRENRYAMGDITNDGLNDIRDFDKFREAYEAAHPAPGAFEAMVAASSVPEPSSILMLAAGAAGLGMWRNRKNK